MTFPLRTSGRGLGEPSRVHTKVSLKSPRKPHLNHTSTVACSFGTSCPDEGEKRKQEPRRVSLGSSENAALTSPWLSKTTS